MRDFQQYAHVISDRLQELGVRMRDIEDELGVPKTSDPKGQGIDLEDDEVPETLGMAAQKEVGLLKEALGRIKNKTYGVCLKCEEPISHVRLMAVPHAPLCKICVNAAQR